MFFISIKRLSMQNVGNVHTKKCHCDLSKFWYDTSWIVYTLRNLK